MLSCPFCGAAETDRFDLEGKRFLVFACMFSPEVDPSWPDSEIGARLSDAYRRDGATPYFRRMCDRVHLYVTAGPGGQALRAGAPDAARPEGP